MMNVQGMAASFPIIAIITLFIGAFLISLLGRLGKAVRDIICFVTLTVPMVLMVLLVKPVLIDGQVVSYWLGSWVPVGDWAIGIGIEVDALSLFFGLIVTIAAFVAGTYSFSYMDRDDSLENYYTLFLMLTGSLLGLVLSGDLFNIFVMIEIMTMTAVALTAFRVDYPGALEGALKYMVVGGLGSTSVLVGITLTYSQLHTLNLAQIASLLPERMAAPGGNVVLAAAFGFLFIGFATKAFLFPFQPLAADAHAVAPASVSMMISGVITKCGVYGIIRVTYDLYQNIGTPEVSILVTTFGALSCFICVTMAFHQHDFKRLLAFHSISQVGYVITAVGLGTALGMEAGLFHAMNHTIFKGLLFLAAGAVQYATGSLDLNELGGLHKKMPRTMILFLIGAASISGLPPFNGFASKWMIYQAAFGKGVETGNFYYTVIAVVCILSSVLTLASFVKVAQSVFFGQLNPKFENVKEVPLAMRIPMWILAGLCILTGVLPEGVEKLLLAPAAKAALNAGHYIDAMLGGGVAKAHGIAELASFEAPKAGAYNPVSWLIMLLVVTCAVCLALVLGKSGNFEKVPASAGDGNDAAEPAGAAAKTVPAEAAGVTAAAAISEIPVKAALPVDPEKAKYDTFFSGEQAEFSQVGGEDLFWGFKTNMRHYFDFFGGWHSGRVGDYTRYGIAAIAVVLLFSVLCL